MYSSLATSVPLLFRLCTTVQRKSPTFKSVVVLISASTSVRCEAHRTACFIRRRSVCAVYMCTLRGGPLSSDARYDPPGHTPSSLPPPPYISAPMTRRFTRLARTAAIFTYLLIVLGAIVRITGSGLGCGEHWPLCNGKLLPPLDVPTLIEYGHRLVAAGVSVLVTALAGYAWWLRKGAGSREHYPPDRTAYGALALLVVQVLLGAVTVKLSLPPWTVILHLGTAMLLLATLLVAARPANLTPGSRPGLVGIVAIAL